MIRPPCSPRTFLPILPTLALCASLAACAGLGDLNMIPVAPLPASETPLPSATIVWFPPSATPSPRVFPTYTSTPERKPDVGGVILSDDFSDPDEWNTAASDQGSAAVSRNRLTLAVQPGFSIASIRKEPVLGNFYAEITARPSLCRGADDYGLLLRAPNNVAAYRFALSCNGSARVERFSVGRAHPLQPPVPSGDVPRGAPGEVRLGVWAVDSELRFFLNGRYQFTVTDNSYPSGAIGVFAQAAGDTPVTVTFSDLVISEVTYIPATRTPLP
jgi:hypothetical protein